MRVVLLVAALALAGCNATMPQAKRPTEADDPTIHCYGRMDGDTRLAVLLPKIGSAGRGGMASIEMLASTAKADETDKAALSAWSQARMACTAEGRQFRAQYAPPGWANAFEAGQSEFLTLMARLYSGDITFGEFNRSRAELGRKNAAALQATAQRASEAAQLAQQQRAAQAAQEAASGMMLMQMARPQPMLAPQMLPQPISCSSRNVMGTVYTDCR